MPEQDVRLEFDELPLRVQQSFKEMRSRLPSEFILRDLRALRLGWAMTIYTAAGKPDGEISVMAEDDELPALRQLRLNGKSQ
jgi:hypothetical protein